MYMFCGLTSVFSTALWAAPLLEGPGGHLEVIVRPDAVAVAAATIAAAVVAATTAAAVAATAVSVVVAA